MFCLKHRIADLYIASDGMIHDITKVIRFGSEDKAKQFIRDEVNGDKEEIIVVPNIPAMERRLM